MQIGFGMCVCASWQTPRLGVSVFVPYHDKTCKLAPQYLHTQHAIRYDIFGIPLFGIGVCRNDICHMHVHMIISYDRCLSESLQSRKSTWVSNTLRIPHFSSRVIYQTSHSSDSSGSKKKEENFTTPRITFDTTFFPYPIALKLNPEPEHTRSIHTTFFCTLDWTNVDGSSVPFHPSWILRPGCGHTFLATTHIHMKRAQCAHTWQYGMIWNIWTRCLV